MLSICVQRPLYMDENYNLPDQEILLVVVLVSFFRPLEPLLLIKVVGLEEDAD